MEKMNRFNWVMEIRANAVLFEKPKQVSPPSSPDIKFLQKQESFSNKSSSQTVSVRFCTLKDRLKDFSANKMQNQQIKILPMKRHSRNINLHSYKQQDQENTLAKLTLLNHQKKPFNYVKKCLSNTKIKQHERFE